MGRDLEVRFSLALDEKLLFELRQVPSWGGFQGSSGAKYGPNVALIISQP